MKKNVLILSNTQNFATGGTEKYSYAICEIFHQLGFEITEIALIDNAKNIVNKKLEYVNYIDIFKKNMTIFNEFFMLKKAQKIANKEVKNKKYDLIIYNSSIWPKINNIDSNKQIYVLHNDPKVIFKKILTSIKKILKIQNGFFASQNIILNYNDQEKWFPKLKAKKFFYVPLFANEIFSSNDNKYNSTGDIYCLANVGRLKNFKLLDEISKNLDAKIKVIGKYNTKDIEKYSNLIFLGLKNQEDIAKNILPKAKAMILVSKYEGFPYACCETLSLGIPLILRSSIRSAPYFINNGNNGVLIDKKLKAHQVVSLINNIEFSKFNNDEIINFAKTNLSREKFNENWTSIIKKLLF